MAWWYGRGPGFGPQSFGAYIISQATGFLRCAAAYLRFQPALIFPLAASRQLRRALTIRYRDSSVDSNIPGTTSIKAAPRANVASIIIRFYIDAGKPSKGSSRRALKNPWPKKWVQPVTGDGDCGLGDSDRRWASRKFRQHPLPKVAGQL